MPGWSLPASRTRPSAQSPVSRLQHTSAAFASTLNEICTPKELVAAERLLLTQAYGKNKLKGKGCICLPDNREQSVPRGTEEWDSRFSEGLQVLTKSHLQLFSPKSRTQHLFFFFFPHLCLQRGPYLPKGGGEAGGGGMLPSPLRLFQPLNLHPKRTHTAGPTAG